MASSPITSWEIDGETVETVADFISLGSKIIADGDCSNVFATETVSEGYIIRRKRGRVYWKHSF